MNNEQFSRIVSKMEEVMRGYSLTEEQATDLAGRLLILVDSCMYRESGAKSYESYESPSYIPKPKPLYENPF